MDRNAGREWLCWGTLDMERSLEGVRVSRAPEDLGNRSIEIGVFGSVGKAPGGSGNALAIDDSSMLMLVSASWSSVVEVIEAGGEVAMVNKSVAALMMGSIACDKVGLEPKHDQRCLCNDWTWTAEVSCA